MKKILLTIMLLVAIPIFASHNNSNDNTVDKNLTEEPFATVCVSWSVLVTYSTPPGHTVTAYFYTRQCAETLMAVFEDDPNVISTELSKGTYCVDEEEVFICL